MSQRFASPGAIQAAHDRIETKRSIAGMKQLTATEKGYAVNMLYLVFPEMEFYAGEKALVRLVGKNS